MIAAPAAAVWAEVEHDLGANALHQPGESAGDCLRRDTDKSARVVIGRCPGHTRVAVVEDVHLRQLKGYRSKA